MADRLANNGWSTAQSGWINHAPILGLRTGSNDFVGVVIGQWINTPPRLGVQLMAQVWQVYEANYPPAPVIVYKMRGRDAAIDDRYDSWLAIGAADHDGSEYHGELSTPLRDVIVIDSWER